MRGPVLLSVAVLRGRERDLAEGLGGDAGRWLRDVSGEGGHGVWLDEHELAVFVEEPPAEFAEALATDPGAASLRALLDACTSFDPDLPGKAVLHDVHHLMDGVGPSLP